MVKKQDKTVYNNFLLQINKNYRVRADAYNFILEEKADPEKCPKHLLDTKAEFPEDWNGTWHSIAFCNTFANLLEYLFERKIIKQNNGSIENILKSINDMKKWIKKTTKQFDTNHELFKDEIKQLEIINKRQNTQIARLMRKETLNAENQSEEVT